MLALIGALEIDFYALGLEIVTDGDNNSVKFFRLHFNKSSAVAEMGDLGH